MDDELSNAVNKTGRDHREKVEKGEGLPQHMHAELSP